MSVDIVNRQEYSPTPEQLVRIKERLSRVELNGEDMFLLAHGMMDGATVFGTNLTIDVTRDPSRPARFGYEFIARKVEDGPTESSRHEGVARLIVPHEGLRRLLDEGSSNDFLEPLIMQMLKLQRRGQYAQRIVPGEVIDSSRPAKLTEEQKQRLSDAQMGIETTVVNWVGARQAGVRDYDVVEPWVCHAVARWIESTPDDARLVARDMTANIAVVLDEVVKER